MPVLEFSFVKQKTLNLSFQTAQRANLWCYIAFLYMVSICMQSLQGFKLLCLSLGIENLDHLRVCFNFFIMKKGLNVKFKARFSVPWCFMAMEVATLWLVDCQLLKQARRFLAYSSPSCFCFYIIWDLFQWLRNIIFFTSRVFEEAQ